MTINRSMVAAAMMAIGATVMTGCAGAEASGEPLPIAVDVGAAPAAEAALSDHRFGWRFWRERRDHRREVWRQHHPRREHTPWWRRFYRSWW